MNVDPRKTSNVYASLLSAAALLSAASASADGPDDAFVAALENYGVDINGHDTAFAHGHAVYAGLDKGQDSSYLALKLMKDTKLNLSARPASFFIGASLAAYCPQYRGSVDPSLIWLIPGPRLCRRTLTSR